MGLIKLGIVLYGVHLITSVSFQPNFSHSLTITENTSAKNDIVGAIKTTTKTPQTTPCPTKNHQDTLKDIPHHPNTNLRIPNIEMRRSCIATCQKGSR
jgi:hypothetical protein